MSVNEMHDGGAAQGDELVLPGFSPLAALWEGEGAPFPSEQAARWAVRQRRAQLIDLEAIALLRGRTFVHREKLVQLMRQQAVAAYRDRYTGSDE